MLGSCAPAMQLSLGTVTASDHVRVHRVTFSLDLTPEKHVSKTCAAGFYWLRQLCRIRRSLDEGSAATLVHAFMPSWIDYCNTIYAGAPKTITDKLQQVLNAAVRLVSNTKKFDRDLPTLLHDKLHWLDVPERVTFKLGLMMYHCLHGQAPWYLANHIKPAIEVASRYRLRSANRHQLIVPLSRLNTYGHRAFPVAGPTVWNSLPDELRDPACDINSFKQFFKTILFSQY